MTADAADETATTAGGGGGAPTGRGRLLERRTSADAHSPGIGSVVFSPDGGSILTGGADGLVKLFSTGLVRGGKGPAAFLRSITGVHSLAVTTLAVHGKSGLLATGSEDQHVRIFDLDALSQRTVLCRTTLGVPHLAFSPGGSWAAVAGEDGDIRLVSVADITRSITLEGHTNTVKCVAFHPDGKLLVSSSADATLRIWQLHLDKTGDSQKDSADCVKVIRDALERSSPGSSDMCLIDWHPSGSHFAACGRRNEVVLIQNTTWSITRRLQMPETPSLVQFSPNGIYLLCVGVRGHVRIYQPAASSEERMTIGSASHHTVITGACWHPKANDLAFIDSEGVLSYVEKVVPSTLPHPVTGREKIVLKGKPKESDATVNPKSAELERGLANLFADIMAEEDNVSEGKTDERRSSKRARKKAGTGLNQGGETDDDEGDDVNADDDDDVEDEDGGVDDDMDDFVVDDDGAGYVDDLKRPDAMRKYHERSRESALRGLERGARRGGAAAGKQVALPGLFDAGIAHDIQAPFQPGATPARGNRRYLAFNLLGVVWTVDSQTHSTVEVEFHDRSIRSFHFTDHYNYTMAALSEHGAAFACEATSTAPSTVFFRPLDSWASKGDWTLHISAGESVKAIAVTKAGVAVATDMHYLRLFSPGGVQLHVRSLNGPILAMSGHGRHLFIVYHAGGVFHGDQNLAYYIQDVETHKLVARDRLPLSPASRLDWIGFSSSGFPVTYDSTGVLRGLFLHEPDTPWVPVLDIRVFRGENKDHHYWAVGVSGDQFMCVVCKGDKYPQFPKPIVNDVPLRVPFAQPEAPSSAIEEEWFRRSLGLLHRDIGIVNHHGGAASASTTSTTNTDTGVSSIFMSPEDREREHTAQDKLIIQLIQAACIAEKPQRALDLCAMLHRLRSLEGAIKLAVHMRLPALAERMNSLKEARYLREKQEMQERQRVEMQARQPQYQHSWQQPVLHGRDGASYGVDLTNSGDGGRSHIRDDIFDSDSMSFDTGRHHRGDVDGRRNMAKDDQSEQGERSMKRGVVNPYDVGNRKDDQTNAINTLNHDTHMNDQPAKKPRNPFAMRGSNVGGSAAASRGSASAAHAATNASAGVDGSKIFDAIAKAAAAATSHKGRDTSKHGYKSHADSSVTGGGVAQFANGQKSGGQSASTSAASAGKRKQMTLLGLIPQRVDICGDDTVMATTDTHDNHDESKPIKRTRPGVTVDIADEYLIDNADTETVNQETMPIDLDSQTV